MEPTSSRDNFKGPIDFEQIGIKYNRKSV